MNSWQKTQRFFEPAWRKPGLYIFMTGFASILGTASGYIQIYMIGIFTDMFARGALIEFWPKLWFLLGFFGVNIVLLFIFRNFAWIYPQYNMEFDIMKRYFHMYFRGNNTELEKVGTGRMINILTTGAEKWSILMNEALNNFVRWVAFIFLAGTMLSRVNGWYSVGMPILFIVILSNTIFFVHFALHWRLKRKEVNIEQSRFTTRMIMSKFEVLQNKRMDDEIENLHSTIEKSITYSKKSHIYSMGSWQLSRFIIACFTGYICINFFNQASANGITKELLAQIGVVTGLMATFMSYYNVLIDWYNTFSKEFVNIEKLWDTFDHLKQIKNYDSGSNFIFKKGNYELKKVSFAYSENTNVISELSLTIAGGKKTALVGRSGGGKTTLMKLLAGYMSATSGELVIDGQDIASVRLDSYYPHIGYLTQEPSVFDGSIEENLLYGTRRKPTKKEMETAINLAECQFINDLEHGIRTEIGERGVRLSGGQKQRLAIAKIFLKDPEIILLDEPTAALDSYSEEKVAKAFEHLFEGRTVIVIAHRLQTVKSADDIIVLEKGAIVERGTHRELLKLGKKYAGMVDLQSGRVIEDDEK